MSSGDRQSRTPGSEPARRIRDSLRRLLPSASSRLLLFVLLTGLVGLVAGYAYLTPDCAGRSCPALSRLDRYRPPEPPHVYARDGTLAGHLPGPRRVVVPLTEVPPVLSDGFVAVEDRRFREHHGVDVRAILRAAIRNLEAGATVEGASTITMQLARTIFAEDVLDYSRWHRKATEVRLAWAIESRLSKSRILELYLNHIYLGEGVYGVGTAALHYFDRPVSELSVAQAALLVGLARNPEGYNPRRQSARALERRNVVLDVLAREGVISAARAREARTAPLSLASPTLVWNEGSYYAAAVRRELAEILPDPTERAGVRVHTGLDPDLQAAAEESLETQIRAIEEGRYGPYRHPVPGDGVADTSSRRASPYLQGLVVAMDAATGEVRALVGGRDFEESEFDRALQARRQPGSAFKPIVLSAALADSIPLTRLVRVDSLSVRTGGAGADSVWWRVAGEPTGVDGGEAEEATLTLRDALVRSSNAASVRMGMRVGVQDVIHRARALGIRTPLPPYPSLFLGSAEVVPAELVAAFAAFENGGLRVRPHLIRRIEFPDGRTVPVAPSPSPAPALDPRVAFLVRSVLEDVVDRGTARGLRVRGLTGPAAGKTGTTNRGRDLWFVGMRPGLVTGVWLGFDRPEPVLPGATGGRLAAPVWGRLMASVPATEPDTGRGTPAPWQPPPGLDRAEVDGSTGYLANESCPREDVRVEYFLPGTGPEHVCPLHGRNLFERLVSEIRSLFGGDSRR